MDQREKAKKQIIPESTTLEQRPTVLIVDDDSAVVDVLQKYFIGEGFKSFMATNALEAIQVLKINTIDVVMTDVGMPGMSGLELTKIIKKEYDSDVIIFTGYEKHCNHKQAVKLGASDFFYKPLKLEEILLSVKRVLIERNKNHLDVH